jgi:hypothetical protein
MAAKSIARERFGRRAAFTVDGDLSFWFWPAVFAAIWLFSAAAAEYAAAKACITGSQPNQTLQLADSHPAVLTNVENSLAAGAQLELRR